MEYARYKLVVMIFAIFLVGIITPGITAPVIAFSGNTSMRADAPIPILEAINSQLIVAWGEPIAIEFSQPMIHIHIQDKSGKSPHILISMGTRIRAPQAEFSDLIIQSDVECTPDPEAELDLNAYSLSYDKQFPSSFGSFHYDIGGVVADEFIELLKTINNVRAPHLYSIQLAVWSLSSDISLEELAGKLNVRPKESELVQARRYLANEIEPENIPEPTKDITPTQKILAPTSTPEVITPSSIPAAPIVTEQATRSGSDLLKLFGVCGGILVLLALIVAGVLTMRESRKEKAGQGEKFQPPVNPPPIRKPPVIQTPDQKKPIVQTPIIQPVEPARTDTAQFDTPPTSDQTIIKPNLIRLIGVEGPLAGKVFDSPLPCVISRYPVDWITIPDPDISSPHAAFDVSQKPYRVKDLNSHTGTLMGETALGKRFIELDPSQEISIGSTQLNVVEGMLHITQGPLAEQSFTSSGSLLLISREKLAVIVTGEPDRRISDIHAVILRTPTGLFIRDLNSSNGTFINQQLINSQMPIKTGDYIKLGNSELELQLV